MTNVLTNKFFIISLAAVIIVALFVLTKTPFKCALGLGEDRQVACETKTKISSTDVPNKKSEPDPNKSGASDGELRDTNSDGQEDARVWTRDINNDGTADALLWDRDLNGLVEETVYYDSSYVNGVLWAFDPLEIGRTEQWGYDFNGDREPDRWAWDRNRDNFYDKWGYDTNFNGVIDLIGYDSNQDNYIEDYDPPLE